MKTVDLTEAKEQLGELLQEALMGDMIVIVTADGQQVQLVPKPSKKRKRTFGSAAGMIKMSDDFDDPLPDFEDYM